MREFHYNIFELTKNDGGIHKVNNLDSAYEFCKQITLSHYENFPVASLFIPRRLRKHINSIYAFARLADDIADETLNLTSEEKFEYLLTFELLLVSQQINGNPVFKSLFNTINEMKIPIEPFQKLLTAFKRDVDFKQPDTMNDLFDYCNYSANPIGEIILRLFDSYNDKTIAFSNNICTGLQLTNFWQDLSVDIARKRIYIPKDLLTTYNLDADNLFDNENSFKLNKLLNELYNLTDNLLTKGYGLIQYLQPFGFKLEMALTIGGGKQILSKLKNLGTEIIKKQIRLSKFDYFNILFKFFFKYKLY